MATRFVGVGDMSKRYSFWTCFVKHQKRLVLGIKSGSFWRPFWTPSPLGIEGRISLFMFEDEKTRPAEVLARRMRNEIGLVFLSATEQFDCMKDGEQLFLRL